jgi:hypothetical protein
MRPATVTGVTTARSTSSTVRNRRRPASSSGAFRTSVRRAT